MTPKKTRCFWPTGKRSNSDKTLFSDNIPDDTWKIYTVGRIFFATDDLLKARGRAKKAEIESEFCTDSNDSNRIQRRKRAQRVLSSETEDGDQGEDSDVIFPSPPSHLDHASPSLPSSSLPSSKSGSGIFEAKNVGAEVTTEKLVTPQATPTLDSLDLTLTPYLNKKTLSSQSLDVITLHLARIENGIQELRLTQNEILARLRSASTNTPASSLPDGINIPCKDLQSLQALETALIIEGNDTLLVNYLSFVGGHKTSAIIRRILEKIFTNDLALVCNWTGKNNKTSLRNLNIVKVIKDAARRHKISELATDAEINTIISNWFRFTKDRDGGREKRRPATVTRLS